MTIEAANAAFAAQIHKTQVRIYPGGTDGGPGNTYRFDAGFGQVMSVRLNCYSLTDDGPTNIDITVHRKDGRQLCGQRLWAPGNMEGAIDLGYGLVLTTKPWMLRKRQRPYRLS